MVPANIFHQKSDKILECNKGMFLNLISFHSCLQVLGLELLIKNMIDYPLQANSLDHKINISCFEDHRFNNSLLLSVLYKYYKPGNSRPYIIDILNLYLVSYIQYYTKYSLARKKLSSKYMDKHL